MTLRVTVLMLLLAGVGAAALLALLARDDDGAALRIAPHPPAAATAAGTPAPEDLDGGRGALACSEPAEPWYGNAPLSPGAESEPEAGGERIGSLSKLRELYGEAPDATVGRVRIPVLGIDAPLGERPVDGEELPRPTGPGDVVWYDLSGWSGLGGVPGGGTNAVFSGHVDYFGTVPWADVTYRGPGVFKDLGLLSPGDVIEIEVCGETYEYAVVWLDQVSAAEGDWGTILSSEVPAESVTLVTCGGAFDADTRTYEDRVVVRAERVTASVAATPGGGGSG
jgi:LPXTG-site transpeptidase (sortase) family protein